MNAGNRDEPGTRAEQLTRVVPVQHLVGDALGVVIPSGALGLLSYEQRRENLQTSPIISDPREKVSEFPEITSNSSPQL